MSTSGYAAYPPVPSMWAFLRQLDPAAALLVALEVAALVQAVLCLLPMATFVPPSLAWSHLLIANLAFGCARICWVCAMCTFQVRAICAALGGYDTARRLSPYTWLTSLHAIGILCTSAEVGLAVALSCVLAATMPPVADLAIAYSATRCAVCLVRAVLAPAEPLRWRALLAGDAQGVVHARRAHLVGRLASFGRPMMCCTCIDPPAGQFAGADVAAMIALAGAEVLGGGKEEAGFSPLRIAAGLELLRLANVAEAKRARRSERTKREEAGEQTRPEHVAVSVVGSAQRAALATPILTGGCPISDALRLRCVEALEMNHFAIGVYTGVLLDCGRWPGFGWLCWLRDQCCSCRSGNGRADAVAGATAEAPTAEAGVEGDNCWGGHRRSFHRYCGHDEVHLLAGHLGQAPGLTTYFCVRKPAARQIVISVRGTETVTDVITDCLMTSEKLSPADLGLAATSDAATTSDAAAAGCGYAFSGVLGAVRTMASELLPVLTSELRGASEGFSVVVVGHSLGGSAAALLALRLRTALLAKGASRVVAYCYQPMPCLSRAGLAAVARSATPDFEVLSLVCRDDFASRLSLQRLRMLVKRATGASKGALDLGGVVPLVRCARMLSTLSCRCLLCARAHVPTVEVNGRARAVVPVGATCWQTCATAATPAAAGRLEDREAARLEDGAAGGCAGSCADAAGTAALARDGIDRAGTAEAAEAEEEEEEKELYLVGDVVHVRGPSGRMQLVSIPAAAFRSLEVTPTFLLDHVPWMLPAELAKALGITYEPVGWDAAARRRSSAWARRQQNDREPSHDVVVSSTT